MLRELVLRVRCCPELVLVSWVCLIFLSSTGIAGELSNSTYRRIVSSHANPEAVSLAKAFLQKSYHVFLFVVLGWLSARCRSRPFQILWAGIFFCLTISTVSEVAQLAFSNRTPEFGDVVLNSFCSGASYLYFMRKFQSFRSPTLIR